VIAWTVPWALTGLLLLAGPMAAHMLRRRNARRIVFPTTRFLQPTRAAAVRLRAPSDLALLALRLIVVLAAVLAAAQPVWLAAWRTARWNQRYARAVVLDVSRSVPSPADASALADREMRAFASARFASDDLDDAVGRAAAWLADAPPARREIVIVSDFQRGALAKETLTAVHPDIGIRFITAGPPRAMPDLALPPITGWRGAQWQPSAKIDGDKVDAKWVRGGPATLDWISTRQPPGEAAAAARALAGAASFGVRAGGDGERAVVEFAGAVASASAKPATASWMLRAALAIRRSPLLRQAGGQATFAAENGVLIVRANVAADSAAAPAVLRTVMLALRAPNIVDREAEPATIAAASLADWQREAALVARPSSVKTSDGLESRWLWAIALIAIGVETWWRRAPARAASREVRADAA
jgi:hypothetical protein